MFPISKPRSEYEQEVKKFVNDLKNKELNSSAQVALASIRLIKKLIGESKWSSAEDLLKILRQEEKNVFERIPTETVVKNIWKRVIKIIKDESVSLEQTSHAQIDSLQVQLTILKKINPKQKKIKKKILKGNLFATIRSQNLSISECELKPIMIEAISEIINEIETSVSNIAAQSLEHIHANEVILTLGKSQTVEAFLKVF